MGDEVVLSSLLLWYGADFGDTQRAVLERVAGYLPPDSATRGALQRLLAATADAPLPLAAKLWNAGVSVALPMFMRRGPISVRYADYDWRLNAAE